ncbi:MAG TPA: LPP20 family lipoprotein [Spirochaetota bacterium]|nr:LPP20 family lipoprotein [Spirochaetota bacterium]
MNRVIYVFLIFSFFVFGISLHSQNKDKKKDVKIKEGAEPSWVKKIPGNPLYYIGIGTGKSLDQAQNAAVNSIASQIKVKIQSEITDYTKETNGVTEEQVTQNIKLNVKESVEDIEVVEIWYSPEKGYWAYYRLDIEKYKKKQQEKMEKAKQIALDYLTKCDNESDVALAFKYAFLGYFNVGKYISASLKANYKGSEIILTNELISRMQKILSSISMLPKKSEVEIAKISPKPVEVVFDITSNKKPIVNFPVKFYNNKGELDITKKSSTDINGNVSCIINRAVKRDAIQSFIAELDIMSFIEGATDDEEEASIFFGRLSNLGIPSKEIIVKISVPVMSFSLDVLNSLAKDKQTKGRFDTLVTAFKDSFAQETGVKFADSGASLKLSIILDGTITQSETSGQFFTKILVTVLINDLKSGEELFTTTSPEIKGGSVTEIKSVQAAIDKYTKEYNKQLVKKVLNYMEGN